jgi:hypothetical protein
MRIFLVVPKGVMRDFKTFCFCIYKQRKYNSFGVEDGIWKTVMKEVVATTTGRHTAWSIPCRDGSWG